MTPAQFQQTGQQWISVLTVLIPLALGLAMATMMSVLLLWQRVQDAIQAIRRAHERVDKTEAQVSDVQHQLNSGLDKRIAEGIAAYHAQRNPVIVAGTVGTGRDG